MLSLGIDIGYSSVKAVLLEGEKCLYQKYVLHHGRPREVLVDILKSIESDCPDLPSLESVTAGAFTGSGSRFLQEQGNGTLVNETTALIEGVSLFHGSARSIVEIGGESAKYITGFAPDSTGGIDISMNSDCAAGTGSFLEEQVSRMNLKLEDYSTYAMAAASIPRIAGRCSVFAKTDITHHLQEGTPVEDILMGLAYGLVKNYRGTIVKRQKVEKPLIFTGGVGFNRGIVKALEDVFRLESGELVVPESCGILQAAGTAIIAHQNNHCLDVPALIRFLEAPASRSPERESTLLPLHLFGNGDSEGKHKLQADPVNRNSLSCHMGIDIGSTSTNVVLINSGGGVMEWQYIRTHGNPLGALQTCFSRIHEKWGDTLTVTGAGITGSGRYRIGEIIGADLIRDEITAQARAAAFLDPHVDTVFEIGGQDSKFIRLKDGRVKDFQMNKVCAAGTGSFIEEQAKKFSIPLEEFGPLALKSGYPLELGERCTVFIESSIAAALSRGTSMEDIASGLCYSIVRNYLNRVVGSKPIGNKIFLQGGIAYNQGVVNAFRVLTGKDVVVPPYFSVTGAFGAALLAMDECLCLNSDFRGFAADFSRMEESRPREKAVDRNGQFNKRVSDLIFKGYDTKADSEKKTVGIPRALFTYGMYPMFSTIFRELGFNVVLSDPTSERTISLGQEFSQDELCYPMKLINGHVAELIEKNVDYIFFPDLHTIEHPDSQSRQNYGCAYMQLAFKIINRNMELQSRGIRLLAPTIAFNRGQDFMRSSFASLGAELGRSKEEIGNALQKGMMAALAFEERLKANGKQVWEDIKPDEQVFVLISKIYGVADPVLNMGIPGILMDQGYKVLSFFELPEGDVSREHPNMYWPFGQHILETAKMVRNYPNMHAVFLTHHCCGPDSVFIHYFSEIMGDKPYLNIEVDEHSSEVGVITRIEAFLGSLGAPSVSAADSPAPDEKDAPSAGFCRALKDLSDDQTLYLPNLFPYSDIAAVQLRSNGVKAEVLPLAENASLAEGRRYTLTNELLSLTALFGDIFTRLKTLREEGASQSAAFFIPQFEGAEVDGQFARLVRTRMDESGYIGSRVFAPFAEDFPLMGKEWAERFFLGILCGDLVNNTPSPMRMRCLDRLLDGMDGNLSLFGVTALAEDVSRFWTDFSAGKCLLAVGEPSILYNRNLTDRMLAGLEEEHRILYASLAEALLMLWRDYAAVQAAAGRADPFYEEILSGLERIHAAVSRSMGANSVFHPDLARLHRRADQSVGYYAGAFGRYRFAAAVAPHGDVDGVLSLASTYENTGITMSSLYKGGTDGDSKPLLNLTFDGTSNENTRKKIESFLFYL